MKKSNPKPKPMAVKTAKPSPRMALRFTFDQYLDIQMMATNIGISTTAMASVLISEALNARMKQL